MSLLNDLIDINHQFGLKGIVVTEEEILLLEPMVLWEGPLIDGQCHKTGLKVKGVNAFELMLLLQELELEG